MRTSNRGAVPLALSVAAGLLLVASEARATDAMEIPDNGSEQGMRGGAWVARASDPLAAFYNPAGLAGQPTRIILQANLGQQHTCFTRLKAMNDATIDAVNPGQSYPQVCNNVQPSVDPQLAMTFRLTPRIGLGIAPIIAPSAANGTVDYPEFVTIKGMTNQPEPGRYLLTNQQIILVTPTIGIGIEPIDRLRVGASLQVGIATFSFTNASLAINQGGAPDDLKANLNAHDYFIPGFTLGTIWSPTNTIDVAGWYKWTGPISASGDVVVQENYYNLRAQNMQQNAPMTDTSKSDCGQVPAPATMTTACGSGGNATIHLTRPMEAKIGARFHLPRKGIPYDEHLRDPMSQDVFDAEVDLTWANDSQFDVLQIRFPSTASGLGTIPINGTPGGTIPPNADVPLHYSDVLGVRIGGDWNVLPDQLAVRGGGFYQTPSQTGSNTQYQGISFATSSMFGLAVGGTYRLHFGPGSNALELSAGFEHVFWADQTYTGSGGIEALAGTTCNPAGAPQGPGFTNCAGTKGQPGNQTYRTNWPVNLGTITNAANVFNVGFGYRF